MYYICIEDNLITSIVNYEPNVPESVSVVSITDEEFQSIENKTHYFDLPTQTVISYDQTHLDSEAAKEEQRKTNAEKREFLNSTDWKVLRHMREIALSQPTTLSAEEYLALEQAREDAAAAIVEIQ